MCDIDLTRCLLFVQNGKGGKARAFPFFSETRRVLYEYLRNQGQDEPDEVLFLSEWGTLAGGGLGPVGVQRLIKRIGKAAGRTGVRLSPHTLRHTFFIDSLRNGGNQFALMNVLGHTSLAMTARYVKVAQADVEAQYWQLIPIANMKKANRKPK